MMLSSASPVVMTTTMALPPGEAAPTACDALLQAVITVINGPACDVFRAERGLRGYTIVGQAVSYTCAN